MTVWDLLPLIIVIIVLAFAIPLTYFAFFNVNTMLQQNSQFSSTTKSLLNQGQSTLGYFDGGFLFIVVGLLSLPVIGAFYIDAHPIFFFVSIFLLSIFLFVTAILSNVFWQVINDPAFSSIVNTFPLLITVMKNFPLFIMSYGFLIVAVMFAKIRSNRGEEF